ncbi:hypothetical protein V5799_026500 [Amblyomma americanum]|uniref:Uncharacterized protein n=1 Tax=Amblyomma americanum TaxID=6943 RepID=A0AAQ4DIE6_AMBAM
MGHLLLHHGSTARNTLIHPALLSVSCFALQGPLGKKHNSDARKTEKRLQSRQDSLKEEPRCATYEPAGRKGTPHAVSGGITGIKSPVGKWCETRSSRGRPEYSLEEVIPTEELAIPREALIAPFFHLYSPNSLPYAE